MATGKKIVIDTLRSALILGALTVMCAADSLAQNGDGRLSVQFMTTSLDSLMTHSARSNNNQSSLEGFRIQIYSGSGMTSKKDAAETQARFLRMYPSEKVYIIYNAPFWRVRVVDYRSRSEAMKLMNKLQANFSGSYIVRDNTVRKSTFRE